MFGYIAPVIVLATMTGLLTDLLLEGMSPGQAVTLTLLSTAGAAGIAAYALPATALAARACVTVTVLCIVLFTLDPQLPAAVTAFATLLASFVCVVIVRWATGGGGSDDRPKRKRRKARLALRKV